MKRGDFWIAYILLLLAQVVIGNFFHLTPFIYLTLLPVMILCLPVQVGTIPALLIAAASGLAVDWLSGGILGLNALALVPVAFCRNWIVSLIFGRELLLRKEDFSVKRYGFGKVAVAMAVAITLFLVIYIWADGAGTRPLSFNLLRLGASFCASFLVSLLTLGTLAPDSRK